METNLQFDAGKRIYLDSAAPAFPKPKEVLDQTIEAYSRCGYDLCLMAGELVANPPPRR